MARLGKGGVLGHLGEKVCCASELDNSLLLGESQRLQQATPSGDWMIMRRSWTGNKSSEIWGEDSSREKKWIC